jgi:5'(3')-deoxyribonucleotidase
MDEIYDHDLGIISNREITRADAISIWDDLALTWHHPEVVQVVEHAKDGVKTLLSLRKKLYIITARNEKNKKEVTYEWISYHFPEISLDQVYFVNHYLEDALPKSTVCKKL